ncbi:hypothetical protein Tsubulata_021156 [Turnera subulata]|uniref:Uncharacterized protein n=1 Tax=Turnera subulata TaxID=218843 RepID=A0A9Q0JL24_9ROSI|nr:hypothetical protein Tsubulata_021156 [Turnera subulata]
MNPDKVYCFLVSGRSPKERVGADSLSNKLNVNEEYKEAFRTKSYVEMWSKVEGQLRETCDHDHGGVVDEGLSSSSPSVPNLYFHLSDFLFNPKKQETLHRETIEAGMKLHRLLGDYFEASLEACNLCDSLLQCVKQIRANHKRIRKAIKLSKRAHDSECSLDNKVSSAIFRELAAYALLKNPLSRVPAVRIGNIHDTNMELLNSLTTERKKIQRRVKLKRIGKKVGGCFLVISHTSLVVALLIIAIHSIVGIMALPGLMGCTACFLSKFKGGFKKGLLENRLCVQLDLAAKGTYILINDFDTMSRLVRRLYEEIEHRKLLADMCIRNENTKLLREVVKEFHIHETRYLDQLEELERHIYLCFHTINRSRRLVLEETIVATADIR